MFKIKVYEDDDSEEVIKAKCKEFLLKYTGDHFSVKNAALEIFNYENGLLVATCSGECCEFAFKNADEFLKSYSLKQYQEVIDE